MNRNLIATKSVSINASAAAVWDVLLNPEKIKIYLFGTETVTDWQVGSPILFQGEFNGQQYKDKGNVLEKVDFKKLQYNYWSGFSGLEDVIDNYSLVTYTIDKIDKKKVTFIWTQQGFSNEDGKCHTENGLAAMLDQIKTIAEQ